MFILLLLVTIIVSLMITTVVYLVLRKSIRGILSRLIGEPHAEAWVHFLIFSLYAIGISSTIHTYRLENYISTQTENEVLAILNANTWFLEIYSSIKSVLGSLAWSLMSFFTIALIAFTIVRAFELKRKNAGPTDAAGEP